MTIHGQNYAYGYTVEAPPCMLRCPVVKLVSNVDAIDRAVSIKYRFDIFNVANTPSFDIPIDNVSQNLFFNDFPVYGSTLYSSPTLSGLGIVNKTIGSPRQTQMTLRLLF